MTRVDIRLADNLDSVLNELENYGSHYLGNDANVDQLAFFIRGWLFGKGGAVFDSGSELLREFTEFLLDRLEVEGGYSWDSLIVLQASNSQTGIDTFFRRYREFQSESRE